MGATVFIIMDMVNVNAVSGLTPLAPYPKERGNGLTPLAHYPKESGSSVVINYVHNNRMGAL